MKCLVCDKFESWSQDELTKHIFRDHYVWVEEDEWIHDGGIKWENKKIKKLKYITTYEGPIR